MIYNAHIAPFITSVPKSPRVGSAVLVVDKDGRFLLGMRAKDPGRGQWVIPGGKVNYGETIDEAGIREIKEETGLDVNLTSRLGAFELIDPDQHRLIIYSMAIVIGGELKAADDVSEVRFFTTAEVKALPLSPLMRQVFHRIGVWE
jgi:8-oxo-dGTP diphosphatase